MAGVDTDIDGEAKAMPNIIDRLSGTRAEARSRQNGPRNRRRRVGASCLSARTRLDEVFAAYGEPDADFEALAERTGAARSDSVRRKAATTSSSSSRSPPTRCGCRRGTRRSGRSRAARSAASRSAGCCSRNPTCCCSTSRRTISTPRASSGSNSFSRAFRERSSRSRTTATSSTMRRSGFSNSIAVAAFRGRATTARGSSKNRSAWRAKKRRKRRAGRRCKRELEWVRSGVQGPPVEEQEPHRAVRRALELRISAPQRNARDLHPGRRAARRSRDRVRRRCAKRSATGCLMDDVEFHDSGRCDRRHHRPERCRQVDALSDDCRKRNARRRRDHGRARP